MVLYAHFSRGDRYLAWKTRRKMNLGKTSLFTSPVAASPLATFITYKSSPISTCCIPALIEFWRYLLYTARNAHDSEVKEKILQGIQCNTSMTQTTSTRPPDRRALCER